MPVSPQDFALWSRMTGNPYPQSPAERMALAPEVYSYTRNIGRQGGPTMSPIRRAVDVAGKVALGAGLLAGAGYLARKGYEKLELDNEPDIGSTVAEAMPNINSQVAQNSGDVTGAKTSDFYNQNAVPHQTSVVQELRGTTAQKPTLGPIEQKPATQSEVISSQQPFTPGTEEEQLASAAQPNPSIRDQAEELIGRVSASQVAKFRQSPSYAAAVKSAGTEELIGDTTPYVEPSPQPAVISGPVRMTPRTRVAVVEEESPIAEMSTATTPVDVGSALKSKGIYLSGDLESGTIQVNTDKGGTYEINHPYSTHPKSGIRQTALQEEQMARDLLQSVGVTPEQAKEYWSTKTSTLAQPKQVSATPATVTSPAPQRKTSEQMEDERLARMAFGNMPMEQATALLAAARAQKGSKTVGAPEEAPTPIITTRQPQPVRVASDVAEVKQKLFQKAVERPTATVPGTEEHLIAQAREHLEGVKIPIPGASSHDIGGASSIKNITLYPGNQVSVTYRSDPETQYAFKSDPRYSSELKSMLEGGHFGPGGMHSAGGFIQAGINKKLLY